MFVCLFFFPCALGCWLMLCQVAELLATYQISKSDIQNLFLKLQKSPTHLVRKSKLHYHHDILSTSPSLSLSLSPSLPPSPSPLSLPLSQEQLALILHKVAETTRSSKQPSAYLEFTYSRPSSELDSSKMLLLPNPQVNRLEPCTLSLWLSVNKYPLKAFHHLFTFFTGDVYLLVWACACSGDIVFKYEIIFSV